MYENRQSFLPAPYESVPDDDLGAAAAATLAVTVGALLAVSLGMQVADQIPQLESTFDLDNIEGQDLALVVATGGWGLSVLFLAVGCLVLTLRRGRGALVFGALLSVGTTALLRYRFEWFTPEHPLPDVAVYYGGVAVLVLALLPGTRRWIAGRRRKTPEFLGSMSALNALPPTSPAPTTAVRARIGPVG